jgi:hypothetical protein
MADSKITRWNVALALAGILGGQSRSCRFLLDFFPPGANLNNVFAPPNYVRSEDILPEELVRWKNYKKTLPFAAKKAVEGEK